MTAQAVVNIREELKQKIRDINRTLPPRSGNTISTADKVWTLPDGASSREPLNVIVVGYRNFNRYYKRRYDPNRREAPSCFALSELAGEGMVPSENAPEPQADNCQICPQNQWGSAPNGGRGKACRNMVRLAVVAPDATATSPIMILMVPPTSLGSWSEYVGSLRESGLHPMQMVARVSFDPNVTFTKLIFEVDKPHDKLETMWTLSERAQELLDEEPSVED